MAKIMKTKAERLPCASEADEQQMLMEWARLAACKWPELRLMHHIPNEGKRSIPAAMQLKRMGLRVGVPDICLPVARGGYHGMYIELKRAHGGRLTQSQREWLEALNGQGYRAVRCDGWSEAAQAIELYMRGRDARPGDAGAAGDPAGGRPGL